MAEHETEHEAGLLMDPAEQAVSAMERERDSGIAGATLSRIAVSLEHLRREMLSLRQSLGIPERDMIEDERVRSDSKAALRAFLRDATDEDIDRAVEDGSFALVDVMDVAMEGLEGANAAAEATIGESGRLSRAFDRGSRELDRSQDELSARLRALVDG